MKIINQTRILFEYFGNIKNPERWVRIGYPNIRIPNKPFHDRSLAGFSPEVAAMEAPAGRRRGKGRRRWGWRITYPGPSSPPPIFFTSCSSGLLPKALLLLWLLSFFVWFEVIWALVGGEVVGDSVCWKRIYIFFVCSFFTSDYVFYESDSISYHGMRYQISCMLDYTVCESVSILCHGMRSQISFVSDYEICESD